MTNETKKQKLTPYPASKCANRTINPIRMIVDGMDLTKNPDKDMIPLSIGDPTTFGNLKTPEIFMDALCNSIRDCSKHGYQKSTGMDSARTAIASRYSCAEAPLTSEDVFIASGCSGALELCIKALVNEGDNILMPQPGFALYQTMAESNGASVKQYPLNPDKNWEVKLEKLAELIDEKTRAIVVNNPSNPCGSVYSKEHLAEILKVAQEKNVPIIADEIYGDLVFEGSTFHAMAKLTQDVPILSVGGIAKDFLVPGFRVGWVLVHDRHGLLSEVKQGIYSLTQVILGANSIVQSALPSILAPEPDSEAEKAVKTFKSDLIATLQSNAEFMTKNLQAIEGLKVVVPQGAMYIMVGIDESRFPFKNDMEFCEKLIREESCFVLPGKCFNTTFFFRVVFCAPKEKLEESCNRIKAFCDRHRK